MTSPEAPYYRPDWDYRIWEFNANHRQLLLRCDYANAGTEQDRSEVWFGNVSSWCCHPSSAVCICAGRTRPT